MRVYYFPFQSYYTVGQNLSSSNLFIQALIPNPILHKGRKADIGVYVVFTSVDPLQVYALQGN